MMECEEDKVDRAAVKAAIKKRKAYILENLAQVPSPSCYIHSRLTQSNLRTKSAGL